MLVSLYRLYRLANSFSALKFHGLHLCYADSVGTVERCLACEAVVSSDHRGENLTAAKEAGAEPASFSSDSLAIPTLDHSAFSRLLTDFERLINRHLSG
jgi:hypothetical protein